MTKPSAALPISDADVRKLAAEAFDEIVAERPDLGTTGGPATLAYERFCDRLIKRQPGLTSRQAMPMFRFGLRVIYEKGGFGPAKTDAEIRAERRQATRRVEPVSAKLDTDGPTTGLG